MKPVYDLSLDHLPIDPEKEMIAMTPMLPPFLQAQLDKASPAECTSFCEEVRSVLHAVNMQQPA